MFFHILKLIFGIARKGWNDSVYLFHRFYTNTKVRFGLVGLLASLSYFILGLLFSHLKWPLTLGNAAAYMCGFTVSYLGQTFWTFRARGSYSEMLLRFAITQLIGLGINFCIIGLCIHFGLYYWLGMIIAIFSVPVFLYLICKYWVFRKPKKEAREDT